MYSITAGSVSDALSEALNKLAVSGVVETSRNGDVMVFPAPVVTTYTAPQNRVLFSPIRDANPFFHMMEALWMLAGRNDLAFPLKFNSKFGAYSDDGETIWGAYGWRWRSFFNYDQLDAIVRDLKDNPNSRRAVLAMWNAMPVLGECNPDLPHDLEVAANGGKDVPCNTHAYFDCRNGELNMTVCNRSNDILWGAYGANAVHFSILQEYLAARIGVPLGVYRQFSNNLHIYLDILPQAQFKTLALDLNATDAYCDRVEAVPLFDDGVQLQAWEYDLKRLLQCNGLFNEYWEFHTPFFDRTAAPMYRAFLTWRDKDYAQADAWAALIAADDWRRACVEWLQRRAAKREQRA